MKLFFRKLKNRFGGNYLFLFVVLIVYAILGISDYSFFIRVWNEAVYILVHQIILVLLVVFLFMFILNLILQKDTIQQRLQVTRNSTKYFLSILGGIFSTGPVYMWYPFLKKLKEHGRHEGHIATFIYARSVKIPFLTVMVMYFGLKYTIIFNLTLIILSLLLGYIVSLLIYHLKLGKQKSLQAL